MTKLEMIKRLSARTGISQYQAGRVMEAFVLEAVLALGEGDEVRLPHFGKFVAHKKPARKSQTYLYKNEDGSPREVVVTERTLIKFQPFAHLNDIDPADLFDVEG